MSTFADETDTISPAAGRAALLDAMQLTEVPPTHRDHLTRYNERHHMGRILAALQDLFDFRGLRGFRHGDLVTLIDDSFIVLATGLSDEANVEMRPRTPVSKLHISPKFWGDIDANVVFTVQVDFERAETQAIEVDRDRLKELLTALVTNPNLG